MNTAMGMMIIALAIGMAGASIADGSIPIISIGNITTCNHDFRLVTLPITVSNATNIGSMQITVSCNESIINMPGVGHGISFDHTEISFANFHDGQLGISAWQENNTGMNGSFVLAYIRLQPTANGECNITLTAEGYDATYNTTPIAFDINNGEYKTIELAFGDVNGNGAVNIGDAMVLAKHLIGISGFENIHECVSDVDCSFDSRHPHYDPIDAADASYLARALLGDPDYPLDNSTSWT